MLLVAIDLMSLKGPMSSLFLSLVWLLEAGLRRHVPFMSAAAICSLSFHLRSMPTSCLCSQAETLGPVSARPSPHYYTGHLNALGCPSPASSPCFVITGGESLASPVMLGGVMNNLKSKYHGAFSRGE